MTWCSVLAIGVCLFQIACELSVRFHSILAVIVDIRTGHAYSAADYHIEVDQMTLARLGLLSILNLGVCRGAKDLTSFFINLLSITLRENPGVGTTRDAES